MFRLGTMFHEGRGKHQYEGLQIDINRTARTLFRENDKLFRQIQGQIFTSDPGQKKAIDCKIVQLQLCVKPGDEHAEKIGPNYETPRFSFFSKGWIQVFGYLVSGQHHSG